MLTLPACHSDSELDLARRIARLLGSDELHVFWTEERPSRAKHPGRVKRRARQRKTDA